MAAAAPRCITLSVVSHGQAGLVSQLFADLARLNPPTLAKVVLTLNDPSEAALSWPTLPVPLHTQVNVVRRGFGANHNAAFAHCDTAYFLVVNPDIRLNADALGALVAAVQPQDGVLAPVVREPDGTRADFARQIITPATLIQRHVLRDAQTPPGATHWVAGMFMLFPREAFAACGGFDEHYFLYCEDFDICARLQLAGKAVHVVEEAQVVHASQRTSRRRLRYLLWHMRSLLRMWSTPVFWQFRAMLRRESNLISTRRY